MSPCLDSVRSFDLPLEPSSTVFVPEGSRLLGLTVVRPAYLGGRVERAVFYAQTPQAGYEVSWRFRLVREGESFDDWERPWRPLGLLTVQDVTYAAFLLGSEP